MPAWIDELAASLGEEPLTAAETAELLQVARDVAHLVERRITPLSTFLLGAAVGRGLSAGETRTQALERAVGILRPMLPPAGPVAGGTDGEAP